MINLYMNQWGNPPPRTRFSVSPPWWLWHNDGTPLRYPSAGLIRRALQEITIRPTVSHRKVGGNMHNHKKSVDFETAWASRGLLCVHVGTWCFGSGADNTALEQIPWWRCRFVLGLPGHMILMFWKGLEMYNEIKLRYLICVDLWL